MPKQPEERALSEVPVLAMLGTPAAGLRRRAEALAARLQAIPGLRTVRVAEDVIAHEEEMPLQLRRGVQVGGRVIKVGAAERRQRRVFPRPQPVERPRRFIRRIRAFEGGGRGGRFHQNHRNIENAARDPGGPNQPRQGYGGRPALD